MKLSTVLICGLGGSGSIGVEPWVRLLMFHPNGTRRIILADCDHYEAKNATRQLFHPDQIDLNKAAATAQRLSGMPNLLVEPVRVDEDTLPRILDTYHPRRENIFVLVDCVDNHASRNAHLKVLDRLCPNYVFITAGNTTNTMQASIHVVLNGEPKTLHPFQRYEDIRVPKDSMPGSCGEKAVEEPQTITANNMSQFALMTYLDALLHDRPFPAQINGNFEKFKLVPVGEMIKLS